MRLAQIQVLHQVLGTWNHCICIAIAIAVGITTRRVVFFLIGGAGPKPSETRFADLCAAGTWNWVNTSKGYSSSSCGGWNHLFFPGDLSLWSLKKKKGTLVLLSLPLLPTWTWFCSWKEKLFYFTNAIDTGDQRGSPLWSPRIWLQLWQGSRLQLALLCLGFGPTCSCWKLPPKSGDPSESCSDSLEWTFSTEQFMRHLSNPGLFFWTDWCRLVSECLFPVWWSSNIYFILF